MSLTFHSHIHQAYRATTEWLDKVWVDKQPKRHYRSLKPKEVNRLLYVNDPSLLNAAAQFHTYFPTHHYKIVEVLHNVLSLDILVSWLKYNPRLCILDIGCGAGAGSSGFVEAILTLQEQRVITEDIEVFCLGIDPNPHAITLYNQFSKNLQASIKSTDEYRLTLKHKLIPDGFPTATNQIITSLGQQHKLWGQPHLAHCIILQMNVVSPLQTLFLQREETRRILIAQGVDVEYLPSDDCEFGMYESSAYRSIFESIQIDNLHIFTISTDNHMLNERVSDMGKALNKAFSGRRHKVDRLVEGEYTVGYYNPYDSYFSFNPNLQQSKFHVNITSIVNEDLRTDKDWQEVIDEDNLRLAWVRARHELLGESFIDEIGIRQFEINLDDNLKRMQKQLIAYAADIAKTDDYIAYKVPKNSASVRPLGISHFEEELLSIAIIQKLGRKESQLRGSSYAYQISSPSYRRHTEYLYKPWFEPYKRFMQDARSEAEKHPYGAIIRIDIRSFFTRILQNQLIEMTQTELSKSERIHWLIKLLLSKNLDDHEMGRGIVQGSPASGFYANIYLTPIDMRFGAENEWQTRIFRFVDDIILVVPQQEDKPIKMAVEEILSVVGEELGKLQLELNPEKTGIYYSANEFICANETDLLIEGLSESYFPLINSLWLLDQKVLSRFRQASQDSGHWWFYTDLYCQLLQFIEIFTTPTYISRQISRYLYNQRRRNKDLQKCAELTIPEFTVNGCAVEPSEWAKSFILANSNWLQQMTEMRRQLTCMFHESWELLKNQSDLEPSRAKGLQTRIKFAMNRLKLLGVGEILEPLIDIMKTSPWVIKEALGLLETLARQAYVTEIKELIHHYALEQTPFSSYLRACLLRSLRFMPSIDDDIWSHIVSYSFCGSVIESLMATESWFFLRDTEGFHKQTDRVDQLRQCLLSSDTISPRLVRNYYLLWKCYSKILNLDSTNIPDSSNGIDEDRLILFEYPEPDIIRVEYYSSQLQGDKVYY